MPRWKSSSTSSSDSTSVASSSSPSLSSSSSSSSNGGRHVCTVCHTDTHSSNLNYGALTCLSCRAFFRRIIQQKLKQELRCRATTGSGKCVITPENRKKCNKCRYDACLRAGMRPQAVLNESQYQRRFRKMISKQQQQLIDSQVRRTDLLIVRSYKTHKSYIKTKKKKTSTYYST